MFALSHERAQAGDAPSFPVRAVARRTVARVGIDETARHVDPCAEQCFALRKRREAQDFALHSRYRARAEREARRIAARSFGCGRCGVATSLHAVEVRGCEGDLCECDFKLKVDTTVLVRYADDVV